MSKAITETPEKLHQTDEVIVHDIPSYSDRTSVIMACLSELVYLKFNKPLLDKSKERLIKSVTDLLDEKKAASIYKLLDLIAYDNEEEEKKLKSELALLNLKLEKTFDKNGTQAMIISSDKFYALAFRGTETTSIKDIKTDLDAKQIKCETEGKMHRGFYNAFNDVRVEIQKYIDENLEDKPLFITGHSLGGALATVATKKLKYEKMAACYTYGSPRVGNEAWMLEIKSPVYRLVNSADPVTMLPPGSDMIDLCSLVLKFVPSVGNSLSKKLESNYGGYSHAGYMRFLTDVESGKYEDAKLLYSVSFLRRIRAYVTKSLSFKDIPADHSMNIYRKKLQKIAYRRQNI